MREKPLLPWVIAESSGKVLACHCNCMAGLGETCSHVASLLWAVEAGVRMRDSMTVTQKKAYWVLPPSVKEVPYAPLSHINFLGHSGSLTALRSLSPVISPPLTTGPTRASTSLMISPAPSQPSPPCSTVATPSSEEVGHLFASLSTCSTKPAILALLDDYSSNYIPSSLAMGLPICLSNMLKPEYLNKPFDELLQIAAETEIVVSPSQAKAVEEQTRGQANSRLWFRMRTGQITASKLKAVCSTDPAMPSASLIMSICHPELSKFSTAATKWGCEHESVAREKYKSVTSPHHDTFSLTACGLFIHTEYPFMGASPDGLVNCLCCGKGICEVKVSIYYKHFNAGMHIYSGYASSF